MATARVVVDNEDLLDFLKNYDDVDIEDRGEVVIDKVTLGGFVTIFKVEVPD